MDEPELCQQQRGLGGIIDGGQADKVKRGALVSLTRRASVKDR